jgi:cell division protein ZapB
MSSQLLEQLEVKVDETVETIEILRLQIEELEEKNTSLQDENNVLKDKHDSWEKTLHSMLEKLGSLESATPESAEQPL